jgi:hypothetical protein
MPRPNAATSNATFAAPLRQQRELRMRFGATRGAEMDAAVLNPRLARWPIARRADRVPARSAASLHLSGYLLYTDR